MSKDTFINRYFATHDLGLSAALLTAGYPLDHLDRAEPTKIKFVFERDEGMDTIVQSYWNDSLKLSLLSFFNSTKVLKNRIHSQEV